MALSLLSVWQKAKPEEKRALLDVAAASVTPDGRVVMSPEERKALQEENAFDFAKTYTDRESVSAEIEAEHRKITEAQNRLLTLHAKMADDAGYIVRRNARWARQQAGRDPLVDVLDRRCTDEANALWPPQTILLAAEAEGPEHLPFSAGGEMFTEASRFRSARRQERTPISNIESVKARQAGLRALAETVRQWGERGEYFDGADLEKKFRTAYDALPKVESLRAVGERIAKADQWVRRNLHHLPSDGPAAA
jgi:hypothetical protein